MVTNRRHGERASLRALCCLLSLGGAGVARAQVSDAAVEAGPPGDVAPARPVRLAEWSLALLGGPTWHSASDVTATDQGILQPGAVATARAAWRPDAVLGLRLGVWLPQDLGLGMELDELSAKAEGVTVRVTTLSLLPQIRFPLLRTQRAPDGLVRLHLGVSLTAAVEGRAEAWLPGIGRGLSGSVRGPGGGGAGGNDASPSLGAGVLAGLSLHLGPLVIFVEQRFTRLGLHFADYFQGIETSLSSRQTIVGVALQVKPPAPGPAPGQP